MIWRIKLVLLIIVGTANGQHLYNVPLGGVFDPRKVTEDFYPVLQAVEAVADEHAAAAELYRVKRALEEKYTRKTRAQLRTNLEAPYVWKGFLGNVMGSSVPNDNEIAVSKNGYLISVMNTTLFRYDVAKDTSLGTVSLQTFSAPLNINLGKYDPRVIYDPEENRFIVVFLAGFTSVKTYIIIGFSTSEHPLSPWHLYALPGNPLNDSLWTDFPMIALTDKELIITANQLVDNASWQTGWRRTIIWQVNKFNGYHGQTLSAQLHDSIVWNGRGIRNLCPVKGSHGFYGTQMYFLSQRNFDASNDTFFLVHLVDTIGSSNQQLTVQVLKANNAYFVPVDALQPSVHKLATNDSRVLGAFYHHDQIQLVGNTTDTTYGTSAFYYGIITQVSGLPQVQLTVVGDSVWCFGYPNIAHVGEADEQDQRALIVVLRSSAVDYPGYGVLAVDGMGNFSPIVAVKEGESYHHVLNGTQRWGDYTGVQRHYNVIGKAWVNGSYATANHKINTWIADIGLMPPPSAVEVVSAPGGNGLLYPNPANEMLTVRFVSTKSGVCRFELMGAGNAYYRLLVEDRVRQGLHTFQFRIGALPAGTYLLRVVDEKDQLVWQEKFVRQ